MGGNKKKRKKNYSKNCKKLRPKSAITVSRKKRYSKSIDKPIYSHRDHTENNKNNKNNALNHRIETNNITLDEIRNEFSINRFDYDDKKEVLRKLLTKDKILNILYSEMFPTSNSIITHRFDKKNNNQNPIQLSSFIAQDFVKKRDEKEKAKQQQMKQQQ